MFWLEWLSVGTVVVTVVTVVIVKGSLSIERILLTKFWTMLQFVSMVLRQITGCSGSIFSNFNSPSNLCEATTIASSNNSTLVLPGLLRRQIYKFWIKQTDYLLFKNFLKDHNGHWNSKQRLHLHILHSQVARGTEHSSIWRVFRDIGCTIIWTFSEFKLKEISPRSDWRALRHKPLLSTNEPCRQCQLCSHILIISRASLVCAKPDIG